MLPDKTGGDDTTSAMCAPQNSADCHIFCKQGGPCPMSKLWKLDCTESNIAHSNKSLFPSRRIFWKFQKCLYIAEIVFLSVYRCCVIIVQVSIWWHHHSMVSSFVSGMDNHGLCSGQLGGIWRLRHERMWGRSDYCSHFMIVIIIIITNITTMLLFHHHRGYFQHRHHHKY